MAKLSGLKPGYLLILTSLEFVLLVVLLMAWQFGWFNVDELPREIGGVLPLLVPWAGALGGVAICFVGLATHWQGWETRSTEGAKWNVWYIVRAPLGAIMGSVGSLMVVFILGTLGTTDEGDIDLSSRGVVVLMLIAFILGYRQETFASLITRVADVVLTPGQGTGVTTGYSVTPRQLEFTTTPNVPVGGVVTITNEGSQLLFIPRSAFTITGTDATLFELSKYPGNVGAGSTGTVEIGYRPTAEGSHVAVLTIDAAAGTQSIALVGSASAAP